jgi:hypothetical protein
MFRFLKYLKKNNIRKFSTNNNYYHNNLIYTLNYNSKKIIDNLNNIYNFDDLDNFEEEEKEIDRLDKMAKKHLEGED